MDQYVLSVGLLNLSFNPVGPKTHHLARQKYFWYGIINFYSKLVSDFSFISIITQIAFHLEFNQIH